MSTVCPSRASARAMLPERMWPPVLAGKMRKPLTSTMFTLQFQIDASTIRLRRQVSKVRILSRWSGLQLVGVHVDDFAMHRDAGILIQTVGPVYSREGQRLPIDCPMSSVTPLPNSPAKPRRMPAAVG